MDAGQRYTDKRIAKLEKGLSDVYRQAFQEVQEKASEFLLEFKEEDKQYRELVEAGKKTEKQYHKWRRDKVITDRRYKSLLTRLSNDLLNADKTAQALIGGYLPDAYAEAYNFGVYYVEEASAIETAFSLYDRDTVYNLILNNPQLLPEPSVNASKDRTWNRQHVNSAITQGLLQGDSIDKVANRLVQVATMDRNAAVRSARTAMTAAENSGRINSYERAQDLGIGLKKEWVAALDRRTRASHRALDGEKVDVDKKFSNGLMYPGDPSGRPEDTYNCRCTLVAALDQYPSEEVKRASKLSGMSYADWKSGKDLQTQQKPQTKFSADQLAEFTRGQLMTIARQIAVNDARDNGQDEDEAISNLASLIGVWTDRQIRNYIQRRG